MIRMFGITANDINERAEQAIGGYVGNTDYLRMNLRDVLEWAATLANAEVKEVDDQC